MKNDIVEVKKLLKSTSIEAFIKYYKEFEKNMPDEKFMKLMTQKEVWKESSCKTIISSGKNIFKNEINELALVYIINVVKKRVDDTIKNNAKIILKKLEDERLKNDEFRNIEILTDEEIYWELKDFENERKIITG